jgi:hypothetical protein
MIWLALLKRFWPYLAGAVLIGGAIWYVHTLGYKAGEASREAYWKPRFDAAEQARIAADARAEAQEAISRTISRDSDIRYARLVSDLNTRFVDADRSIRTLSVRIATLAARGGEVSTVPGAAGSLDAAAEIERRAAEAGGSIAEIGAGCEADAAQLAEIQRWIEGQRSALNR